MAGLPVYPGEVRTAEGAFLRAVSKVPLLNGYEVTVTFTATDTVTQRHSLGRAYRGCIVYASTVPTSTPHITVTDPETASRAGVDIANYFQIGAETSWSGTVTIWLF